MWDCDTTRFVPVDDAFVNAMRNCFAINVIIHCRKCGCKIETLWNAGTIDGNFKAIESEISEIWGYRLPRINYAVCLDCYNKLLK